MRYVGLSNLALQSVDVNLTSALGLNFDCLIFLFSGNNFESIQEVLENEELFTTRFAKFLTESEAVCTASVSIVNEDGKAKLKLSNNVYYTTYKEDEAAFLYQSPNENGYNVVISASEPFGNCIMYQGRNYINNLGGSTNAIPSLDIPPIKSKKDWAEIPSGSDGSIHMMGMLAGRQIPQIDTWINFGRKHTDTNGRRRDYTCVMFENPVEADFIHLRLAKSDSGTLTTQAVGYIWVVDINGNLINTNFPLNRSMAVNTKYIWPIQKRLITGVAILSAALSTSSTQTSFYLTQFGAGLRDWQGSDTFLDMTRPDYTQAVIMFNKSISSAVYPSNPLLLCSVGDAESDSELKITGQGQRLVKPDFLVNGQTLLELTN